MSTDIKLHKEDLPENLNLGPIVACDSEFTGLTPGKDKLCLIQLYSSNSKDCLLYTSPSPRDGLLARMPSSA